VGEQQRGGVVGVERRAPCADVLVQRVVRGPPAREGVERGVGGPRGIAERGPERAPLLVGGHRDGEPAVEAAGQSGTD